MPDSLNRTFLYDLSPQTFTPCSRMMTKNAASEGNVSRGPARSVRRERPCYATTTA